MDVRAWSLSYCRMRGKNLTCWKSEEKYSYNVFISQKQHSSARACEGKDVLKCAWMWPKWFVLWDLSLFLFTPQFIKKTSQWDKKNLSLSGCCLERKKLSGNDSLMVLKQQLIMQGILHLIPTQTLSILCALSPEVGMQWHLPWQGDTFEWSWIIEFTGLFVTRCWGSRFRPP